MTEFHECSVDYIMKVCCQEKLPSKTDHTYRSHNTIQPMLVEIIHGMSLPYKDMLLTEG